jgi:hypothetical protein
MTVKYRKSEVDIRQAVDVSSKKSGLDNIPTSSVNRDHMGAMDHDLIPMWTHWNYTGSGGPASYPGITDGGRTVSASNGNNGDSIQARLGGTARGDFEVSFTPGYYWGWSAITLISAENWHDGHFSGWSFSPKGDKRVWIANNSSNNQTLIQYWDGSTTKVILQTTPGVNNGNFKVWRQRGKIQVLVPGQSTVSIPDKWDADLVVLSGNQSPHSTTINSAGRLSDSL